MPESDIELSDSNFTKLRAIIHRNTGITIADGRKSLLLSRLRSRLRETGEPDFRSYIVRVSSDADELQELINRITTNKTYFYRTPRIWEHFSTVAVPEYLERNTNRSLRVWSAASSTGEEACTIGVLLEDARRSHAALDYTILGTDVSSRVIAQAEAGVYADATVKEFRQERPDLFEAHVNGAGDSGFRISPAIRARIKFKRHNLLNPLTNTRPFDVIFLRNVLIYFTTEDQEAILRNVHAALAPAGVLYIGESETLTRLDTDFEIEAPMIYRPAARTGG